MEEWFRVTGEVVLREIGIMRGQYVLDFGCGSGNYTIPAARIVGEEGVVYALDKDEWTLNDLKRKSDSEGLKNIISIDTSGKTKIGLKFDSVDVVLLYDIFWYFPLGDKRLSELLNEVHRVLKPRSLLSVYPKHIDSERLQKKIESHGFHVRDVYTGMLLHDRGLEEGEIINFIKNM